MVMRARLRAAGEAAKDRVGCCLHEKARERWRAVVVGRREVRKDIFFGFGVGWD